MTNGFVTFAEIKVKERRVPGIKSIKIRLVLTLYSQSMKISFFTNQNIIKDIDQSPEYAFQVNPDFAA